MPIASQKFWDKYPFARVPRKDEPEIPYVDFAIIHRIFVADGKMWPRDEELPRLTQQDLLYTRCSDVRTANVMRYQGKWYGLTRSQSRKLSEGVWKDSLEGVLYRGV